jgi:hypothetical protein
MMNLNDLSTTVLLGPPAIATKVLGAQNRINY